MSQNEAPHAVMKPAFPGKDAVPVVFSSSSEFVPVCATVIRSLAKFSDPGRLYDVVILHREIEEENQKLIVLTVKDFPNVSVRFYNTSQITDHYQLQPVQHIPIETYYRFLIPEIITGYDKVLYMDCDIICLKDVGSLYDTDLGDSWIGAVKDADMQGQIVRDRGTELYVKDTLKMEDPFRYFQAGVLLLNTAALKKVHTTDEWLTFASEPYRYMDQDILNRYCYGHVTYLDMSWNVLIDCEHFRVPVLIENGLPENRKAYHEARKDPAIVHYAGFQKPWNHRECDLAWYFWEIARETPLYEKLLGTFIVSLAPSATAASDKKAPREKGFAAFVKRHCPRFLFPLGKKIKHLLHL